MTCFSTTDYILSFFFFFFNDTATTEIYTLSLHDALPISSSRRPDVRRSFSGFHRAPEGERGVAAFCSRADHRASGRTSRQFLSRAHWLRKNLRKLSRWRDGTRLPFPRRLLRRDRFAGRRRTYGHLHRSRPRGAGSRLGRRFPPDDGTFPGSPQRA